MDDFNKSPDEIKDDAKQVGQEAMIKAKDVASDAQSVVQDAAQTGRAYAKDAVNAAGKKIDSFRSQLDQTTDYLTQAINAEPVKAVLVTAVLSSLLTALVLSAVRSNERYY